MIPPRTLRAWFRGTPLFISDAVIGARVEGQKLVLGRKAGPGRSNWNLLHEMAHFLEIEEHRMFLRNWGLGITTQVEVEGHFYPNVITFQACAREIRVMARQKVLAAHFGAKFSAAYGAMLIERWVDGSLFADQYYQIPEADSDDYDREKTRQRYIRHDILQKATTISIDALWSEWCRRVEIVEQKLKVPAV